MCSGFKKSQSLRSLNLLPYKVLSPVLWVSLLAFIYHFISYKYSKFSLNVINRYCDFKQKHCIKKPISPQAKQYKEELSSYGISPMLEWNEGEWSEVIRGPAVLVLLLPPASEQGSSLSFSLVFLRGPVIASGDTQHCNHLE